jgi:hypothetical protein
MEQIADRGGEYSIDHHSQPIGWNIADRHAPDPAGCLDIDAGNIIHHSVTATGKCTQQCSVNQSNHYEKNPNAHKNYEHSLDATTTSWEQMPLPAQECVPASDHNRHQKQRRR